MRGFVIKPELWGPPAGNIRRDIHHPSVISSGGALPLRLWMTNVGNAPCYQQANLCLRLSGKGGVTGKSDIKTQFNACGWSPGDSIYNEILNVPVVKTGMYDLELGIFTSRSEIPLALAAENRSNDGYYSLSEIEADDAPRPEMFNAWDEVYPDGYYPLEDPKAPV